MLFCLHSLAKEINNPSDESAAINGLGNVYGQLGNIEKAMMFRKQALDISSEIKDLQNEGIILGNLRTDYLNLGENEKAKIYYLESIAILETIESPNVETF